MIPIAVYKHHTEDIINYRNAGGKYNQKDAKDGMGGRGEEKSQRKSYMWLHPPKLIELSIQDELFVLCEKNEKDDI